MRGFRDDRRWTLYDLGRYADMHPDYLGLIERGLNIPSLNTVITLAEAFGIPVATHLAPVEAHRKR
ncbi:MAG TPA: helix-turn-helix transcriptional regulator, partial [Thermoanaerobaculia bacterium]